ncbi:alpha/beta fold hydrolase [Streptomyces sp. NPDC059766]|uniref:alpha/beta fold hydrolase n=1 Tax=Streptomyces sp. NPDC059766 TaxID=3346940 RepID=UPI00365D7F2D
MVCGCTSQSRGRARSFCCSTVGRRAGTRGGTGSRRHVQARAADFALHGDRAFTGPLNWYRNIERNSELLAAFRGRAVEVPALYIVGDRDLVMAMRGPDGTRTPVRREVAPHLRAQVVLPGCGHWTRQERPAEVNAALGPVMEVLAE